MNYLRYKLLCWAIICILNLPVFLLGTDKKTVVFNGIDVLAKENYKSLQGKRIGLLTNHTGRDKKGNSTIDLLFNAPEVELISLFAPEHGIRGDKDQAIIEDSKDAKTGLHVYSLYGKTRKPTLEQLKNLDALVFDIQDIGCRFYTYISTMANAMEVAGQAGIEFIVLDRINPINGISVEGPVQIEEKSFVGIHSIAIRHGMTIGELALMLNEECSYNVDLTIVQLEGWKRSMWQDDTDIPWVNPSPNMRSLWEATLYPGIGVLEFTPISVGRGTTVPFELLGAPYIDKELFANYLREYEIPYVDFIPFAYTPTSSVFANQLCYGLRFNVIDRDRLQVMDLGVAIAKILYQMYPKDYSLKNLSTLMLHKPTENAIRDGKSLDEIHKIWESELKDFKKRRSKYLLYH